MRSPAQSPFSPGSDTIPDVWAGRVAELSDWSSVLRPRRLDGIAERGRTILGEPGMGKSTLVRRIARDAEAAGDWVTPQLRIPLGADPIKMLGNALLDLAARSGLTSRRDRAIKELIGRVESVSVAGASLTLREGSGETRHEALTALLVEIGREAMRAGDTMVFIHLDEVQNITSETALSQLLIALGDALVHEETVEAPGGARFPRALPLAVYLTGLPEFADLAGARHGATFARRFQTTTLEPLAADDLSAALVTFTGPGWKVLSADGAPHRIRMETGARDLLIQACAGEPFLFQLAGAMAWYAGTGDTITTDDAARGWESGKAEAETHVARILDRLPPREREFIEAMADLSPENRTLSRISTAVGNPKTTTAGPVAQRLDRQRGLISRGRPYAFKHRAVEAYLTTEWPDLPSPQA